MTTGTGSWLGQGQGEVLCLSQRGAGRRVHRSDVISLDFLLVLHREQRNFLFTMEQRNKSDEITPDENLCIIPFMLAIRPPGEKQK